MFRRSCCQDLVLDWIWMLKEMCGIKDDSRFLVLSAQVHERSGTN